VSSKHLFIAVAGNIGVGKSSLTRLIAEQLGWQPFFEAVDENPYLVDFYQDMERWSFHSQVFFLARRLQHHRRLLDHSGHVIQDRSIYEDAEVFAENLYRQQKLSERDYRCYQSLYKGICDFLPPPDLLVYLRASVGVLAERIAMRGRDYERGISIAYLAELNILYEDWVRRWQGCPVVTVATDGLDFVHQPTDFEKVMTSLQTHLANIAQQRNITL
jgi:deoxyadenosine/deoxycytidine kinase